MQHKRHLDKIEKELFGKYHMETRMILEQLIFDLKIIVSKNPNDENLKLFYDLCQIRLKKKIETNLVHISKI